MPYGRWEWVDVFLNELRAQKLTLKMHRKNPETGKEEEQHIFLSCQLRQLPGGLYEFIFPKEHMNLVLTGLNFAAADSGHSDFDINKEFSVFGFKIKPIEYLKKFLRIEDIPEFDSSKTIIWDKMFVSIIPIGVRYEQGEVMEKEISPYAGWWHEAI